MNAVEIEAAISDLALEPFDAAEFPFTFLAFEASKQTQWMQQKAEQSLADTRPNVTHAQAMASAQAVIDAKRNKHASDDLADLVGYIADDNPDAAQELKDEIESKAAKLPEHPRLYKLSPRVKGTSATGSWLALDACLSYHAPYLLNKVHHGNRDPLQQRPVGHPQKRAQ